MDYLLTGATGLIGRHVLFELLKQIIDNKQDSKIWLVIRAKNNNTVRQRIVNLLRDPETPDYIHKYPITAMLSKIGVIDDHLNSEKLADELKQISSKELVVIHNAASTNLMPGSAAEKDVQENNNLATKNLLDSLDKNTLKRFAFVSTAYACGNQTGLEAIPEDYQSIKKDNFRNPYEQCKAETEDFLEQYCEQNGIDLQILRPAIVSGRLIDKPFYCTTKFDVFYGWAKFFYKMKNHIGDEPVRIHTNPSATLNIVPVDYVSKVICSAVHHDDMKHVNIVNPSAPLNTQCIASMLKSLGVQNFEFIEEKPEDLSVVEKLYYNTAGKAFAPYITNENQVFDTRLLDKHFKNLGYKNILSQFENLMQYAIEKRFA